MSADAGESGRDVALVHDYLTQYGGAEKVLEALHEIWPQAPIFTTFFDAPAMRRLGFRVPARVIHPLLPARLRWDHRSTKLWTPIFPELFRRLDLRRYRLVVSSTSFAAHQVRAAPGATHIAYVHSPPRFLYGLSTEIDHVRLRARVPCSGVVYRRLRRLDQQAATRVAAFVANSGAVRARIQRIYGRSARIIYPPVDTAAFAIAAPSGAGDYFLTWSRLVASKRIDILVDAATSGGFPLVVAGAGPEEARLRARAGGTVRFAGRVNHAALLRLIESCRAVLFAAEEDFGIMPVEAMAAGKPVIAYGAGGACETVEPGVTGEFFAEQSAAAVLDAMRAFEGARYARERCIARAARFDRRRFIADMRAFAREAP